MKKPIKLVQNGVNNKQSTTFYPDFGTFTMVAQSQPDWTEDNPSSPSYIKNKEIAEQYRPININGETFLTEERESGALDIVSSKGIEIDAVDGKMVISGTEAPNYIEGAGINIVEGEEGERIISIEKSSIDDEMIDAISVTKLTQDEGEILILYGGSTNG